MPTSWSPTNDDWMPYSTREVFLRYPVDMDKSKVSSTGHTPEDSQAVASEINSDSGDGCDSMVPVSMEPKNGTTSPHVSAITILVFLCFANVTGFSPQMDCWDQQSNCLRYKDDQFCKPGIDKHTNEFGSWLFINCQKTCICDKLSVENATDKKEAPCQMFQLESQCLQRPPAEEFRNKCPFTCFYSRTPALEGFLTSPKNKTVKEGMNVSLECSINSTSPRVNFTWFKNDIPVDLGKTVQNNSYTSILIIGAALADEGEYHCRATNSDYGQVLSVNSSRGILSIEKGPNRA